MSGKPIIRRSADGDILRLGPYSGDFADICFNVKESPGDFLVVQKDWDSLVSL